MADNTRLNEGAGGDLYRSLDRTGTSPKIQIVALDINPSGAETLMDGAMPVIGTFWQTTQPVSGTVSAAQSGDWSTRSQDGAGNALTSALRGSERALSVQIVDASGNQVTSFGGGGGVGDTSLLALESGGHLAAIDSKVPTLGQALAIASVPVVLTSAQLTTLTPLSTVAVTGTFWQATQPVSGTVTANAGTGTFAISASALPLPSGASTSLKQPAFGTAGTASIDVLTIQGIASMTAVKVDGSGVTQPVSGTFWQATQPVSGTFWQATQPVSLAGSITVVGTGTFAMQASQSGTWNVGTVTTITNVVHVDDNAGSLTVDNAGTFAVQATQSGTWTVTGAGGTFPATQSGTWNIATVTTLTGITNVVHVDDNSGSLTVDNSGTFAVQAAQSGTWNVGTVTTVTAVTAVTAITNALPAGTNLLGQISASVETGTVYNGTTALTPKFAIITASASGATQVVAAVTSKKIRVLRWRVSANGAVNIKWQSHVTPTDKSGLSYCTQFKDCGGGWCPAGHFETIAGEALDINLSASIAVSGELTYVEV